MNRLASFLLIALLASSGLAADEIRVAAASNFKAAISELARRFEDSTGHDVVLIFGSTGKHYAQIVHGAPFDLFFAADRARPERLEREGRGLDGSRFTYAVGRLVLWSADAKRVDDGDNVLAENSYRHLAIANPSLAPYGRAAKEALQALGLWDAVAPRLVTGENIAQAYQYVRSGNAELGLVAWSQVLQSGSQGSSWLVPESLHAPIEQQCIALRAGEAAARFLEFVRSEAGVEIIRAHGYGVPDDS
jgi:molybdate transport system substrate-binding protein